MFPFNQKLGYLWSYRNAHRIFIGSLPYAFREKGLCGYSQMAFNPSDSLAIWINILGVLVPTVLGQRIGPVHKPTQQTGLDTDQYSQGKNGIPQYSGKVQLGITLC